MDETNHTTIFSNLKWTQLPKLSMDTIVDTSERHISVNMLSVGIECLESDAIVSGHYFGKNFAFKEALASAVKAVSLDQTNLEDIESELQTKEVYSTQFEHGLPLKQVCNDAELKRILRP